MIDHSKTDLTDTHKAALDELIAHAGSITHLARMLQVPTSTAHSWYTHGRISKWGARRVEAHPTLGKKFNAATLRPELQYN